MRQAQTPHASCSSLRSTPVDGPESSQPSCPGGSHLDTRGRCGTSSWPKLLPPRAATSSEHGPHLHPTPVPQSGGVDPERGACVVLHTPSCYGRLTSFPGGKVIQRFTALQSLPMDFRQVNNGKNKWVPQKQENEVGSPAWSLQRPCAGATTAALVYRSGNFQGPGTGPDRTRLGSRLGMDQAV